MSEGTKYYRISEDDLITLETATSRIFIEGVPLMTWADRPDLNQDCKDVKAVLSDVRFDYRPATFPPEG